MFNTLRFSNTYIIASLSLRVDFRIILHIYHFYLILAIVLYT